MTHLVVLALVLTVAVSGCRKRVQNPTPLPNGGRGAQVGNPGDGGPIDLGDSAKDKTSTTDLNNGSPSNPAGSHEGWPQDREVLKAYTVYFDFDRSAIPSGEASKVTSVADYLKTNGRNAVLVEGHCDERGTEGYNVALGERRALAIREELIRAGVDPKRVDTVTFGKDRPAVNGHDEASWSKNRRGEFILLSPP